MSFLARTGSGSWGSAAAASPRSPLELLELLELTPGGRSLFGGGGGGVGSDSFWASLAASRETASGNGLSSAVGFFVVSGACPLELPASLAASRETASGKALSSLLAGFGGGPALSSAGSTGVLGTGWVLGAGFFCGWGASGTAWPLPFWVSPFGPSTNPAVRQARIRYPLRIVTPLKFRRSVPTFPEGGKNRKFRLPWVGWACPVHRGDEHAHGPA